MSSTFLRKKMEMLEEKMVRYSRTNTEERSEEIPERKNMKRTPGGVIKELLEKTEVAEEKEERPQKYATGSFGAAPVEGQDVEEKESEAKSKSEEEGTYATPRQAARKRPRTGPYGTVLNSRKRKFVESSFYFQRYPEGADPSDDSKEGIVPVYVPPPAKKSRRYGPTETTVISPTSTPSGKTTITAGEKLDTFRAAQSSLIVAIKHDQDYLESPLKKPPSPKNDVSESDQFKTDDSVDESLGRASHGEMVEHQNAPSFNVHQTSIATVAVQDTSSESDISSFSDSDSSTLLSGDESESLASSRITAQSRKLKKKYIGRRNKLRRLRKKRRDENYIHFLKGREEFVQREARDRIDWKRKKRLLNNMLLPSEIHITPKARNKLECSDHFVPSTKPLKATDVFLRYILFERYHTMPSFLGIIVYCISHQSLYEASGHILMENTGDMENQRGINFMVLMFGLLLLRISGGAYSYMSSDRLEGVKFDLHNKVRLRDLDALLLVWFKKRKALRKFLEVVGIYLCLHAVAHFLNYELLPFFCDIRQQIIDGLPSNEIADQLEQPTVTRNYLELGDRMSDGVEEIVVVNERRLHPSWTQRDEADVHDSDYLWKRVSMSSYYYILGQIEAPVYSAFGSTVFYTSFAAISSFALYKLGLDIGD